MAFRAGAATSNITPDIGLDIVGGFLPAPSTHVHDELHARCLVLDDGKTKVALVVCDLLGLHRSVAIEARKHIESAKKEARKKEASHGGWPLLEVRWQASIVEWMNGKARRTGSIRHSRCQEESVGFR